MMDRETCSVLENICFKYERLHSLLSCLWMAIAEGTVEVAGLPENTLEYSLYEIGTEMNKNNKSLMDIVNNMQSA